MNISQLILPEITKLIPYSAARDEFSQADDAQFIFLDANENPFETKYNRYPDPYQKELIEQLSKLYAIPNKNICIGNGSDEIIDLIIRCFVRTETEYVLITPPTYGMYEVSAQINRVLVKKVDLNTNFQPNIEEILKNICSKTKLIFLCSPNNPTGTEISLEQIEQIASQANCIVLLDQAYIDFAQLKIGYEMVEKYPNLILLRTFSKAWGLAGLRIGYCIANQQIIQALHKIKPPYNVNVFSAEKALAALYDKARIQKEVQHILEQRDWLTEQLKQFDFVEKVFESHANFILIKVKNAKMIYKFLLSKNIVVRDRSSQKNCENCLRITIGLSDENQKLIQALKNLQIL